VINDLIGKTFEDFKFQTKSKTSFGVHVEKPSQQRRVCVVVKFSSRIIVNTMICLQKMFYMLFGIAQPSQPFRISPQPGLLHYHHPFTTFLDLFRYMKEARKDL